jgi:Fur family ferric uptake transcriptional regulator
VCRRCGAITDVDCVVGRAPCLEPAESYGFDIDEAEVTFWGLCDQCQRVSPPAGPPAEPAAGGAGRLLTSR